MSGAFCAPSGEAATKVEMAARGFAFMVGNEGKGSGLLLQPRDVRLEPVETVVPLRAKKLEIVVRILEWRGAQCPWSELRIASPDGEPRKLQDLEMLGNRRVANFVGLCELGPPQLARAKPVEHRASRRIR